jgi:hypothetical protein
MHNAKDIKELLNNHLISNFDENISLDDSYKAIKSNDFTTTYKGKHGFFSVKRRGYKIKSVLNDGFLVSWGELFSLGLVFYEQLPFYDEMIDIKNKLRVYADAISARGRLHLAKVFVYFPLDGQQLHYLLTFDTGDHFIFISDIPEMLTNPVEFTKNKLQEDLYQFLHVDDDFHTKLDELFFNNHKKRVPTLTKGDFLVAIMETI